MITAKYWSNFLLHSRFHHSLKYLRNSALFKMNYTSKGVIYDANHKVVDCLFCRIQKGLEPGTIVFEDEQFVVFKTTSQMTLMHLLVTPRCHIKNAGVLSGPKDAALVRRMVEVGKLSLGDLAPGAFFAFHIPPFNSIDHLHLHAIARPETMSWFGSLKYNSYMPYCATADHMIATCEQTPDRPEENN